ncbi:hypothetical protein GQ44DRAFT_725190 [Phaeosphaeriaceae sp. PMI808]|nr:hypothetical protein GQ44DRAFT_725190 [Phaeosphaeriaceae sp. PMI808]
MPGQWATHSVDVGHIARAIVPPSEQLRTLFKDHVARVEGFDPHRVEEISNMHIVWGKKGSQQRKVAENAFLYQLQHDPLFMPDKSPEECLVWFDYQGDISLFDYYDHMGNGQWAMDRVL